MITYDSVIVKYLNLSGVYYKHDFCAKEGGTFW